MAIAVDGRRTDDDLRKLISAEADLSLKGLLEGGYIELVIPPSKPTVTPNAPRRRDHALATRGPRRTCRS
jgi:hypothetical protein